MLLHSDTTTQANQTNQTKFLRVPLHVQESRVYVKHCQREAHKSLPRVESIVAVQVQHELCGCIYDQTSIHPILATTLSIGVGQMASD